MNTTDNTTDHASDEANNNNTIMGGSGSDEIESGSEEDDTLETSNNDDSIDQESGDGDVIITGNGEDTIEVSNGDEETINHEEDDDQIEVNTTDESDASDQRDSSDGDPITDWGGHSPENRVEEFLDDLSNGFWTRKSKRIKIARGVFTDGPNKQRVPGIEFVSIGRLERDSEIDDLMEQISGFSTRKITRLLIQANPDLF